MELLVEFVVRGKPEPRGSKQAFVVYANRATKTPARRADGSIIVSMSDDNPQSKKWMNRVEAAAAAAWHGAPIADVGLHVDATFFLARPQSHHGSGRNAHLVRDAAPARPIVVPDLDKLVRGTLDACTGVVWRDDSLIVGLAVHKAYGVPASPTDDGSGVLIRVSRAAEQRAADLPIASRVRWLPERDQDAPEDSLLAL